MNCVTVEEGGGLAVERPAFGWVAFHGAEMAPRGKSWICDYTEVQIEIGLFRHFSDLVSFVRDTPSKVEEAEFANYTSRRGLGFLRWVLQQLPILEQETFAALDDRTGTSVQCYTLVAS